MVSTVLGLKEGISAISYAKPLEGKPFVGFKDSSTDSWNNTIAADLAKIKEDKEAQARRRMDLIKNSIIRQHEGKRPRMGKDAMFYDYEANEYYHK